MRDTIEAAASAERPGNSCAQFDAGPAAAKPRRAGFRRRLFEFFNSGPGRIVSAPLIDMHFRYWKLRHGASTFASYYARSIATNLERGGAHKTLGGKPFLAGPPFGARGRGLFEAAVREGLKPHHACADYGCGSLRVGQHLIGFLDPGNYSGFDIVADFYEAGLVLLPPGLAAAKRPRFFPIVAGARAGQAADFVVSFAVMKHVPPGELARYFAGIAALMAPGARALITFTAGRRSKRIGAKIWAYDAAAIANALGAADAALGFAIRPLSASGEGGTSCLVLQRAGKRTGCAAPGVAAIASSDSHFALTTASCADRQDGAGSIEPWPNRPPHDPHERKLP